MVNIATDLNAKRKAEAYAQLLAKIETEEEQTWGGQFITACMLTPSKDDNGEVQDIEGLDAVLHFAGIGWKLLFSFIPPAHYAGGWACFFVALIFIGGLTSLVQNFAEILGCTLGIQPSITAITIVALGTSMPDLFASMHAA